MHLIDDIHTIFTYLWRYSHLFYQITYIIHRIIRCSIQFMYIKRTLLIECLARFTFITCLTRSCWVQTVYRLRKYTSTCCLTHASRTTKQICMCQMVISYCILQRCRQRCLTYHRLKRLWPILTRRYNILFHNYDIIILLY